jgi:hypothetical protein
LNAVYLATYTSLGGGPNQLIVESKTQSNWANGAGNHLSLTVHDKCYFQRLAWRRLARTSRACNLRRMALMISAGRMHDSAPQSMRGRTHQYVAKYSLTTTHPQNAVDRFSQTCDQFCERATSTEHMTSHRLAATGGSTACT